MVTGIFTHSSQHEENPKTARKNAQKIKNT